MTDKVPTDSVTTISNKMWYPIERFISDLNKSRAMPAVHHYTSLTGALGILESGRLWFTERYHLNDPSEISYGIDICKELLNERGRSDDASRLEQSANDVFDNFRFFSASFSLVSDDINQWRNYADGGRCVALSFKASAFESPREHIEQVISDVKPMNVVTCPMSYDRAKLREIIGSIIDGWNGTCILELREYTFMISSMFKNENWQAESEYRYFVHQKREVIIKSNALKMRERDGEIVSYLEIPIKNWVDHGDFPIWRIVVGPTAPLHLEDQIADFLVSRNIPIKPHWVARSEVPFTSIRQI